MYLDEDIWKALHIQSRQRRTSISELVRMAVRDRYGASQTNRRQAMIAIVGMWRTVRICPMRARTSDSCAKESASKGWCLEIRPDRFGYLN